MKRAVASFALGAVLGGLATNGAIGGLVIGGLCGIVATACTSAINELRKRN